MTVGKQSVERLCAFALDLKVAGTKQCTLDGDVDYILATRFLKRFVEHDAPWLQ